MDNEQTNKPGTDQDDCCPTFVWEFHIPHQEMNEHHARVHRLHTEMRQYTRYLKYLKPCLFFMNMLILYLLFNMAGIKTLSISIACFIIFSVIMQFIVFRWVESRILSPVNRLIRGVQEIAKGNYDVNIEGNVPNDLGSLIISFNEMARKLQEGERLKAEYEENRKTLIANISHDIKTPITSMQGYLEAMLEGMVPPDKVDAYLKTIYHNTLYTNKLIDDLFLYAKLDMQKLDFRFESVQLRPFMYDLFEEFQFELVEQQIEFHYSDCLEEQLWVNLDGKRMHQAIRNIIGNAAKYGSDRNLVIKTKLYKLDGAACIEIMDNGPGISQDKLPYIFDRFYRIDRERTKDLSSTGLGLSIAKELIEAHGGKIQVSSVEAQGTCFTIALPVATNKENAQA